MTKSLKTCPYCANKIKEGAIKCQYCHEFLNKNESEQRNQNEITPKFTNDTGETKMLEILSKRNVPLQQKICGQYFNYDKDQIFYKGHIQSRFGYYWWRIGIVLLFLCGGLILGIIPLMLLFGPKRIKCLCVSEEGIGCNCYGHGIFHRRFIFVNYSDIESVNVFGDTIKVIGKREFSFNDILEMEKLTKTLKKYKYKITYNTNN